MKKMLIIGYGNMAGAMLAGWLASGVEPGRFAVLNRSPKSAPGGVRVFADLAEAEADGTHDAVMLGFKPHLAPIKVAVLPLKKNHDGIVDKAKAIKQSLQQLGLGRILYENTGNIGKGYRRHDEVGTPLCVTVDFQTIEEDDTVTVRDRDSMAQERVAVGDLKHYVIEKLTG